MYQYIEETINLINEVGIFKNQAFEGCTLSEILQLEEEKGYEFPSAIKEFLLRFGKKFSSGNFNPAMYDTLKSELPMQYLRAEIKKTDKEDLKQIDLNNISIISFEEWLGEYFWSFVFLDEGNNPIVYHILNNEYLDSTEKRFSDFLFNEMKGILERLPSLYISRTTEFEEKTKDIVSNKITEIKIENYAINEQQAANYIAMLPNLKKITFNKLDFQNIPRNLSDLSHLTHLEIEWLNKLDSPLILPKLIHLTDLRIYDSNLISIMSISDSIPNVGRLSLTVNQLSVLPIEIMALKEITHLYLNDNQLSDLPMEMNKLKKIERLSLSNNHLKTIPPVIYELNSLKHLYLEKNMITEIGNDIQKLANLETLNIDENCLVIEEVEKLKSLLPNTEITNWNQKYFQILDGNYNLDFKIFVDEDEEFEKTTIILKKNKIHFAKGSYCNRPCIFTSKHDYDKALELLS